MKQVTYTEARQNLSSILYSVCNDCEEIYISRKNGDRAVIISASYYESMKETAYLLSNYANRQHIFESINEAEAGKTRNLEDFLDECKNNSKI